MFRSLIATLLLLTSGSLFAQNASPATGTTPQASPPHANTTEGGNTPTPAHPPAIEDSQKLTLLKSVPVTYPASAQAAGIQGYVVIQIATNENGDVEKTDIVRGNPALADAAVDSLKQWKFQPFIKDRNPVNASIVLGFQFEIADGQCTNGVKQATVTTPAERPVQVAGKDMKPFICKKVEAVYPKMAELAKVQGDVVMGATITKGGLVENLHVIATASPLLNQSAIDAVRQWRFHPYLVSGEPVEVQTTISVTYSF